MVQACFKNEHGRLQRGNSEHETLRKIPKNKSQIKMGTGQERCEAEGGRENTGEALAKQTQMKKLGCQMTHIKVDMEEEEEEEEMAMMKNSSLLHSSEKRTVVMVILEYNKRGENS